MNLRSNYRSNYLIAKSNLNDILKKASTPKAYSTYAVIGVVATAVLMVICTKKYCENEKNSQIDISENQSEEMTREEVIEEGKQLVKTFAPAAAAAAVTIFLIKRTNTKWIHYNELIDANYISTRDKMARYRWLSSAAVVTEIIQGFAKRQPEENVEWFCIKDFPNHPDIFFQSTKADVYEAEYHLNRNFQLRGSASVREFFAFLGILDQFPEEFEDLLGWDAEKMYEDGLIPWIDFEHWHITEPDTNQRINVIGYTWEPDFSEDGEPLAFGYEPTGTIVGTYYGGPQE